MKNRFCRLILILSMTLVSITASADFIHHFEEIGNVRIKVLSVQHTSFDTVDHALNFSVKFTNEEECKLVKIFDKKFSYKMKNYHHVYYSLPEVKALGHLNADSMHQYARGIAEEYNKIVDSVDFKEFLRVVEWMKEPANNRLVEEEYSKRSSWRWLNTHLLGYNKDNQRELIEIASQIRHNLYGSPFLYNIVNGQILVTHEDFKEQNLRSPSGTSYISPNGLTCRVYLNGPTSDSWEFQLDFSNKKTRDLVKLFSKDFSRQVKSLPQPTEESLRNYCKLMARDYESILRSSEFREFREVLAWMENTTHSQQVNEQFSRLPEVEKGPLRFHPKDKKRKLIELAAKMRVAALARAE